MTALGICLFVGSVLYLAWCAWRGKAKTNFPAHGWMGLAVWPLAALGLWWDLRLIKTFLTPIVWTGYVLAVDGAVFRSRGRSMLISGRAAFGWMALISIGLWLVFEAYNLRLQNWRYSGVPDALGLRVVGYLWSFATIWPAVLETAELVLASGVTRSTLENSPARCGLGWAAAGAVLLVLPLAVPVGWSAYLFGLVWLGFIFLLDPLNQRAGRNSVWSDRRWFRVLCWAGMICGFVWEFWNYWAQARWVYIFPLWQDWKIFEMPLPGYLGFPAFAVEVFVMYVYVTGVLRLPYYEAQ